jgi:cytoskeletal protein CcmA (bactofilin family)
LDVGGKVDVGGDLRCEKKIKVGGTVVADGRIDTYRIIVGGLIDAKYVKADGFRLGRRAEVTCPVEAREILVREEARTQSLYGDEIRIEERARVGSIYGRTIYLERDVKVEGEVLYTESLETERDLEYRSEPKKVDTLPPPEELR